MASGWTVDTLKTLMDERYKHQQELRRADQKAIDVALKRTDDHFEQLNENAKRTIEERGHFITHEAFDPFKEDVQKQLTAMANLAKGAQANTRNIIASIGAASVILSIVVMLANNVF